MIFHPENIEWYVVIFNPLELSRKSKENFKFKWKW